MTRSLFEEEFSAVTEPVDEVKQFAALAKIALKLAFDLALVELDRLSHYADGYDPATDPNAQASFMASRDIAAWQFQRTGWRLMEIERELLADDDTALEAIWRKRLADMMNEALEEISKETGETAGEILRRLLRAEVEAGRKDKGE